MAAVVVTGVAPDVKEVVLKVLDEEGVQSVEDESDATSLLERSDDIELLILGELVENPVRTAERLGLRTKLTAVLIVVQPERVSGTKQSIQYSPLLSGDVRFVSTEDLEEVAAQVRSIASKARRRRRFRAVLPRLHEKVPVQLSPEQRALYLDTLLAYAPLGVVVLDLEGKTIDLNREAQRFLSVTAGAATGRPVAELLPTEVREDAERLLRKAVGSTEGSVSARVPWPPPDRELHIEMIAVPFARGSDGGTMLILRDITADVHVQKTEFELREQRAVARALEEQADELRRLNEELAARNEELQQFAYIASHDLQEPLRKIASFTDLLFRESADSLDENAQFYLERVQAAALRMSDLIRSLLRFSRAGTQALEEHPIDLNAVLKHVQADLLIKIQETDADIQIDELPMIEGDEGQIRQLFQNLVANGIKFHKTGERPKVHVFAEESDRVRETDGRKLHRIAVVDEGIGFDDQYAERIFTPFQRLHAGEDYPGTGMGLAICSRIAERHGGSIEAKSNPGEGATFIVELPAVAG